MTHPDDTPTGDIFAGPTSLEDLYTAMDRLGAAAADVAVLAGRHLADDRLAYRAEHILALYIELRGRVQPAAVTDGPF